MVWGMMGIPPSIQEDQLVVVNTWPGHTTGRRKECRRSRGQRPFLLEKTVALEEKPRRIPQ